MLLYDLLSRFGHFTAHYTESGIMPLELIDLNVQNHWGYSPYFLSTDTSFLHVVFAYQIFMALCFLVGYKTRFSQFMSWYLLCSLQARNPPLNYGADSLLVIVLFLTLFLPLDDAFSFKKNKSSNECFTSGYNFVYVFQIACLYFFAALSKTGSAWWDGSALFMALSIEHYNNSWSKLLLNFPELLTILTYLSLAIEFIAPLLLFHKKCRWLGVSLIIALQVGIMLAMDVGIFPFISLIALIPMMGSYSEPSLKNKHRRHFIIAGIFFFVIFYSNIMNTLDLKRNKLDSLISLFELQQSWEMFSPNPPDGDSWFVLSVETENMMRIDLLNQGKPVSNQKHEDFKSWLINDRWSAYYFKLAYSQNKDYLNRLAEYHLEKYNQEHQTNYKKAELYMLYQATYPAESKPELLHLLFKEI